MSEGSSKLAELEARLRELSDKVRAELPERARALREAIALLASDEPSGRTTVGRLAHMVRGTAGSHGMSELTAPAAEVEHGAKTMPVAELSALARALADRIDRTAHQAPAPVAAKAADAAPVTTGSIAKPLEGRRVLAIDDDGPTRRLLTMTLANLGGATTRVDERPDAFFAALAAEPFDVVIVDAMMPELNGLACLERIAGSPLARDGTCYFVLSAATVEELRWTLPSALRIAWLRKPFRPRELLDAIRAQIAP